LPSSTFVTGAGLFASDTVGSGGSLTPNCCSACSCVSSMTSIVRPSGSCILRLVGAASSAACSARHFWYAP